MSVTDELQPVRQIHVVLTGVDHEPGFHRCDPMTVYFLKNFLEKEVTSVSGLSTTLQVEVAEQSVPSESILRVSKVTRDDIVPMLMTGRSSETVRLALEYFIEIDTCLFHVLFVESDFANKVVYSAQFYKSARFDDLRRQSGDLLEVSLIGDREIGAAVDSLACSYLVNKFK